MNGSSVKQIVQPPFFLPVSRPFLNFNPFSLRLIFALFSL